MQKIRQWSLVSALLLTGLLVGSVLVWADTDDDNKTTDAETVEDQTPEKPHFEQSLEVTTHPALLAEDSLDGRRVRAAEIPDLGTALRSEPGLGAARRGPINLEPQVRGLVEGQLLVLVDGTRTYAAGPGRMDSDLSHVGPRAVKTVRVVKGPYALAWGPGAFAAIDVETFSPTTSDSVRWGAHGGVSYADNGNLGEVGATLWGSSSRWRYWLGHQAREGANYETGGGETVPGDFESAETRWGFGWDLSPRMRFEYRGNHQAQDDVDYAGRLLDATFFRHTGHQLKFGWNPSESENVLQGASFEIYSNDKRHRMNNDEK
ncbi:MAG: TonB-dependent receptor plug domain-containing protein, partial [Thermoanaerobaculia bacterium]|nr:TonB-dependent receptor plug domain-containing protein [Thermoanaerobaculia bacterium]